MLALLSVHKPALSPACCLSPTLQAALRPRVLLRATAKHLLNILHPSVRCFSAWHNIWYIVTHPSTVIGAGSESWSFKCRSVHQFVVRVCELQHSAVQGKNGTWGKPCCPCCPVRSFMEPANRSASQSCFARPINMALLPSR
jgi:hypothetical protein